MSKSLGNTVEPQKVIKDSGADILRLWVCATDYADDQRIGPEILKNTVETYRKLRNTIRWMLGTLHHFKRGEAVAHADMPELERLMLHQLAEQAAIVRQAYAEFDYKTVVATLVGVHEHRTVGVLFRHPQGHALLRSAVVAGAQGGADHDRHHLRLDPEMAGAGAELHRRGSLADVPPGRRAVGASDAVSDTGSTPSATTRWPRSGRPSATSAASSPARSSSNARPRRSAPRWRPRRWSMSADKAIFADAVRRRSRRGLHHLERDGDERRSAGRARSACTTSRASPSWSSRRVGTKCARSWKILPTVGEDPEYPDVSPRDAQALREWKALGVTV